VAAPLCDFPPVPTGSPEAVDPPTPVNRTLAVQVDGFGAGRVTSDVGGIDFRTGGEGTCTATVTDGTRVTLTGTVDAGSTFGGWSQACSGAGTCVVTVNADATVGARFDNPRLRAAGIGPAGGVLQSADGSLTLTVPAGALSAATTLTVEQIETSELGPELAALEEGDLIVRRAYRLGPSGTTFAQPALVSVVSGQKVTETEAGFQVATEVLLSSSDGAVEVLENSAQHVGTQDIVVSGELSHFSVLIEAEIKTQDAQFLAFAHGVPAEEYTGNSFKVTVSLVIHTPDLGPTELVKARFTDASVLPVVHGGFGFETHELLKVLGVPNTNIFRTVPLPYACDTEPGVGLFRGTIHVEGYYLVEWSIGTQTVRFQTELPFDAVEVVCVRAFLGLRLIANSLLPQRAAAVAAEGDVLAVVGAFTGRLDRYRIGDQGQIAPAGTTIDFCPGATTGFSSVFPGFQGFTFFYLNPMFGKACIGSDRPEEPPAYPVFGFTPGFGANIPGTGAFAVTRVNPPGIAVFTWTGPPRGIGLPTPSCPGAVHITPDALAIILNRASPAAGGTGPCGPPGAFVVNLSTNQVLQRLEFGTSPTAIGSGRIGPPFAVTDDVAGQVHLLDFDDGRLSVKSTFTLPFDPGDIAWVDERHVAITDPIGNTVALADTGTGNLVAQTGSRLRRQHADDRLVTTTRIRSAQGPLRSEFSAHNADNSIRTPAHASRHPTYHEYLP
jgi:hypothetical protein